MAYRRTSRGLSAVQFTADFPRDFMGFTIPCDVWFNWIGSPSCWKRSLSDWQNMANAARSGSGVPFDESAIQAPLLPGGDKLTVPPADEADANAAVDDILARTMTQTQANLLRQAQERSGVGPPDDEEGTNWWKWVAIGAGVFALGSVIGGGPRRYGR